MCPVSSGGHFLVGDAPWVWGSWGMCVCVTGFSRHGSSVLSFFGERTALVVVHGGCSIGSGVGRLVRGVGEGM